MGINFFFSKQIKVYFDQLKVLSVLSQLQQQQLNRIKTVSQGFNNMNIIFNYPHAE